MMSTRNQIAILMGAGLCVFGCVAAVLLRVVAPRRDVEFLLIGAAATMAALLAIFGALHFTMPRVSGVFARDRQRKWDS